MKIAVFVYGEFREFDSVVKYWDFLKKYDCDVYLSTWDYSFQANENLGYVRERYITNDMVKDLIPNIKYSILHEKDYYSDYQLPNNMKKRTKRVILHWKNCLKMMKESGIKYDLIILNRTDNFTVFDLKNEYLNQISKQSDRIYGLQHIYLSNPNTFHLVDLILYGNYNAMCEMIEKCPNNLDCIHNDLSLHIMSCNLYVEKNSDVGGDVGVGVFRPNSLELIKNNELIDIHKIANKHRIWEETMIKK